MGKLGKALKRAANIVSENAAVVAPLLAPLQGGLLYSQMPSFGSDGQPTVVGGGDPISQGQINAEEEALRTEGYSSRAFVGGGGSVDRFNGNVLAKQLLAGKAGAGLAALSTKGSDTEKALYAYMMQRQAEVKAGGTTPKTSVAPLIESRNEDMSKALDKATALLNSLKSGKTLLG